MLRLLVLAVTLSAVASTNVDDKAFKIAFAATSGNTYRATAGVASPWTTQTWTTQPLATIGYNRIRHCYFNNALYMLAITTSGGLRVVKYTLNNGTPSQSASYGVSSMSSDVTGVFCNKGEVFVIRCVVECGGCAWAWV